MKRNFIPMILMALFVFTLTGCSAVASLETSLSYKSINGEVGSVEIISGGKVMYSFPEAKILYSDVDTNAVMFKTDAGKYYYQEGFLFNY